MPVRTWYTGYTGYAGYNQHNRRDRRDQHKGHSWRTCLTLALVWSLLNCAAPTQAQAQTVAADTTPQIGQVSKDSVWVPTPERMIRRMLQVADTSADDVVMDLGSGDGRVPIHAAKHFGARAIGVELEANLIRVSEDAAKAQGVAHLTRFVRGDMFETDLSVATVFALYISPGAMLGLKPKLLALKPGTRIVSHHFTLGQWEPDESFRIEGRSGYLWLVPADVRGRWRIFWQGDVLPDDTLSLRFEQTLQMLRGTGERGGAAINVVGARLRGTEISFTGFDRDGQSRQFHGRVDGARMSGESSVNGRASLRWSAARE